MAMRFNATGSQLAVGQKFHVDHPLESSGVLLFDFDRCSGLLSNYSRIPIPKMNINLFDWSLLALDFSACSRFLYLNRGNHIDRYDLTNLSDFDTVWRLAIPAGMDSLSYIRRGSFALKASPFDKLYFGVHYRKIVNNRLDFYSYPESPYDDQLFEVSGDTVRQALTFFDIPGYLGSYLPNVPNYALGPLVTAYAYQRNRPPIASICPKYPDSIQLGRWADTRNLTYQWAPAVGLSDPTDPMPRAKPARTTTYTLTVRALPHVDTACGGNRSWHSDTIRVEVYDDLKPLDLSIGARVCGEYIELRASNTGHPVIWSTGDTTQTLRATTSGTYTATSASARCAVSDTISIEVRDSARVALPADTTWCPSWGLLELRPDAPNARRYFWSTRELTPAILAADTGTYWVRVVDEAGCVGVDSIRLSCPPLGASIDGIPATGDLHIPNAFSPNGDGLNETFQLLCGRCVFIELSIYDRWGRLVFASHDLRDAWDGRHMPEGVYAFRVRYRLAGEGNDREGRGVVSVVR
jgi:gliding motility-associated-like protein